MRVSTPVQTFTIAFVALDSAASMFARTTSSTYTKSAEDDPSPKSTTGLRSSMRSSHRIITSRCFERMSCRAP